MLRLLRTARRFGTVSESNPIDMGYVMSLIERPVERPKTGFRMTPERWPDISVSSSVFKLNLDEHRMEKVAERSTPDVSRMQNMHGEGDEEFWPLLSDNGTESLNEVIDNSLSPNKTQDAETSLRNIEGMLKTIERGRWNLSDRRNRSNERFISHLEEISFGDLKNKSLYSVLSKAFDVESIASDAVAEQFTPIVQEQLPTTPETMLVLGGIDLHLVEFSQLQGLANLYGIESQSSRSQLERKLCKWFGKLISDGSPVKRIQQLSDETLQHFTPERKQGPPTTWTEEEDLQLVQFTEKIRDARRHIVNQVNSYLKEHNCIRSVPEADESVNLWEVVAQNFVATPKACRKRWMLLLRMRGMREIS